jgi:hypothetical protein
MHIWKASECSRIIFVGFERSKTFESILEHPGRLTYEGPHGPKGHMETPSPSEPRGRGGFRV